MADMSRPPRFRVRSDEMRSLLYVQGRRQDWLARNAGVSRSLVSHALSGRMTLSEDAAHRIAGSLQVPFALLFELSVDAEAASGGRAA